MKFSSGTVYRIGQREGRDNGKGKEKGREGLLILVFLSFVVYDFCLLLVSEEFVFSCL